MKNIFPILSNILPIWVLLLHIADTPFIPVRRTGFSGAILTNIFVHVEQKARFVPTPFAKKYYQMISLFSQFRYY
jgi:hypothetical protein